MSTYTPTTARRRLAMLDGWKVETVDVPEDGGYQLSRITHNGKDAAPIGRCGPDASWRYLLERGGQVPNYLDPMDGPGRLHALSAKLDTPMRLSQYAGRFHVLWYKNHFGLEYGQWSPPFDNPAHALAVAILSAADGELAEIVGEDEA